MKIRGRERERASEFFVVCDVDSIMVFSTIIPFEFNLAKRKRGFQTHAFTTDVHSGTKRTVLFVQRVILLD